jgi:urease accessory protein
MMDSAEAILGLRRDDGALAVRFEQHGKTVPVRLSQHPPFRLFFPRRVPGEPMLGIMFTTSGGVIGGDVLRVQVEAGRDATATLTSQEAEKIYGSIGPTSRLSVKLRVEEGATLEWLPQETILFQGARVERRVDIDVAPGGSLLAVDLTVFGLLAERENFKEGALLDVWRVRRGGRLAWAEGLRLEGDIASQMANPAGFDGATAAGFVMLVADDAEAWIVPARERLARAGCRAGVTVLGGGVLLARLLDTNAARVRREIADFASWLRGARFGHPARMPRSWSM